MSTPTLPDQTFDADVAVAPAEPALRRPSLWNVVMLNDDFTPMDFVIRVLMDTFEIQAAPATRVMLKIHQEGRGVAGVYPREIAELKQQEATQQAEEEGHPLRLVLERQPDSHD